MARSSNTLPAGASFNAAGALVIPVRNVKVGGEVRNVRFVANAHRNRVACRARGLEPIFVTQHGKRFAAVLKGEVTPVYATTPAAAFGRAAIRFWA